MQGTQVQSPVQEDSTCHGTTKQGHHKYCAHAPQLLKSEHLGLYSTIREAAAVRSPCSETEWFPFAPTGESPQKASEVEVSQLCPTLCNSMDYPWNSPVQNPGVGSLSLLQGVFPIQGSNPGLLHCRWLLCQLSHRGSSFCIQTCNSSYLL